MKGPAPVEIPHFFTVEWYREQKELKRTDKEIANTLLISIPLLAKWKKKIGWEPGKIFSKMCGRKRSLDPIQIRSLKEQGLSYVAIAEQMNVTPQAIFYWVK
jgi:uncharacterized protein YjcR